MKYLKFYEYFVLLFVLLFITCPIVRADTELINDDISQSIIEYAKNNIDLTWLVSYNITPAKKAEIQTILETASATSLTNCFNNNLKNLLLNADSTLTKDNLSVAIIYDGYTSDECLWLVFFASKDNMAGSNWINAGNKRISFRRYNNNTWYRFRIKLNSDGTFSDYSNNLIDTIETAEFISNDSDITINNNKVTIPGYYSFTNNQKFYLNYDYYSNNYDLYYNETYYTAPQNIVNTDQSPYGYLWSPATSGEHRVNLLYSGNTIIDCDYFIGNNLSHTYNFYYMSGDTKISVNDHISIGITQTQSGEWYKHYITNSGKQHLPNNTHFLLDVYASYGNQTATVVEGFNAFYTVEEVITTPTPTPTTEPTIGTISGQINDINNNISNSTQTIVEQISGDTQKITESIEEVQEFLSEEIENNKSGEIENALNVQIEITDPTADFFTWFFNQIKECFTVTGNQTLTFEILENQITINSDDYIINIPILSTILGTGSGIFILYGILQDIRKEIEKIKEGKFEEIGKEDISANML